MLSTVGFFKHMVRNALLLAAIFVLPLAMGQSLEDLLNPAPGEWPTFGRTLDQQRFSPLDQINRSNIEDLRLVWSRDLSFTGVSVQGSPTVWDGIMYVTTDIGAMAMDATTGDMLWRYDGDVTELEVTGNARAPRGGPVVYEGKLFITLRDPTIVALDALTGEELWTTQVGNPELREAFSTNPIFAGGKIVVGPRGADGGGAPGKIHALDIESGEILWTFDVVPRSAQDPAYATWQPEKPSWEAGVGGGSAWNAGAYDPGSGTVIYGTGQPTPWDRASARRADPSGEVSADLYTASFVGLDVDTGEIKWYHQVVPGDEWDYDQHTVPIVTDLEIEGEMRRVAVLATTTGFIVVVDAATGEFLLANQGTAETTVHLGYESDGTPIINPEARYTMEELEQETYFRVCPGIRWAHIAPGAFSPETGLLYRPNDNVCMQLGAATLPDDWQPGDRAWYAGFGGREDTDYFDRWGALSAIDPVTGEIVWEYGLGYPQNAGPVVTAGGLVFSSFSDRTFRALDAETGEVLFEQVLTAHSEGGTITYAVDGVQYVATIVGRTSGTGGIPSLGLPDTVAGSPSVFVFALR